MRVTELSGQNWAERFFELERKGSRVPSWALGDYERELSSPTAECFLWPDESMRAFVLFRRTHGVAQVMQWAVGDKGQGLGLLVFGQFLDFLRKDSTNLTHRVELEVRSGNQAAVSIYKRLGFVPGRVRPDYYGPGLAGVEFSLKLQAESS
jgi:ribosomal protein S18 acetylase RimI-like enzyme